MAYGIQDPIDLARTIAQMSYGGLMQAAEEMVKMNAEGQRDVKTPNGMAETLFDWATYVIEEDDKIEAAKAKQKAA